MWKFILILAIWHLRDLSAQEDLNHHYKALMNYGPGLLGNGLTLKPNYPEQLALNNISEKPCTRRKVFPHETNEWIPTYRAKIVKPIHDSSSMVTNLKSESLKSDDVKTVDEVLNSASSLNQNNVNTGINLEKYDDNIPEDPARNLKDLAPVQEQLRYVVVSERPITEVLQGQKLIAELNTSILEHQGNNNLPDLNKLSQKEQNEVRSIQSHDNIVVYQEKSTDKNLEGSSLSTGNSEIEEKPNTYDTKRNTKLYLLHNNLEENSDLSSDETVEINKKSLFDFLHNLKLKHRTLAYRRFLSNTNSLEQSQDLSSNDKNDVIEDRSTLDNDNLLRDPAKGADIKTLDTTKLSLLQHTRVCYACSTLNNPTCWQPDRRTTVKYCRSGHEACVTKTFENNKYDLIVTRDCGKSCDDTDIPGPKYKSCSVCHSDMCNDTNGSKNLRIIKENFFLSLITVLVMKSVM